MLDLPEPLGLFIAMTSGRFDPRLDWARPGSGAGRSSLPQTPPQRTGRTSGNDPAVRQHGLEQRIRLLRRDRQGKVAEFPDRVVLDRDVFHVHACSADVTEQPGQRSGLIRIATTTSL